MTPNDAIFALQALELLEQFTVRADIAAKHVVLSINAHSNYETSRRGPPPIKLTRQRLVPALIEIKLGLENRAASGLRAVRALLSTLVVCSRRITRMQKPIPVNRSTIRG
ncbi:MAG: hypothetical protein KGJ66_11290 [Alphaproteobacteria bacterium]|nr:hypothetical protein [Alphaproteobacteria bacterium]